MPDKDVQESWFTFDGIRTHCLQAGDSGSPVVLIHGAGLDSALLSWAEVIGPLGASHQVFAPDLPGYGRSDRPVMQYTVEFYIKFVKNLLDELHLEKVSLVGLSLGGAIALGLTLEMPGRIEKLVLVSSYGIQDKTAAHRLSYLYVHLPYLDELSYWLMGRSRGLIRWSLLAGIIYSPEHLTEELIEQVYRAAREPGAGKAFISVQRNDMQWNGLRSDFRQRLSEIRRPTLLIHGREDTAVPLDYAKSAQRSIAGSKLYIMEGCRHWPQREKPGEFNQIVGEFLQGEESFIADITSDEGKSHIGGKE